MTPLPEGWAGGRERIVKDFEFGSFMDAIGFVNRVAERAEAADHHPDLDIRYRKVTVSLTTHSAGEVTDKDLRLAAEIEACTPPS